MMTQPARQALAHTAGWRGAARIKKVIPPADEQNKPREDQGKVSL
jgi:hypothetical protein